MCPSLLCRGRGRKAFPIRVGKGHFGMFVSVTQTSGFSKSGIRLEVRGMSVSCLCVAHLMSAATKNEFYSYRISTSTNETQQKIRIRLVTASPSESSSTEQKQLRCSVSHSHAHSLVPYLPDVLGRVLSPYSYHFSSNSNLGVVLLYVTHRRRLYRNSLWYD